MVKKQRGETSSSLKMEKVSDNLNLMLESSDDEAPEEVTFEDSKAQALKSMKLALDTARRDKALLKEKRKKRQELFQEQKKRKLLPAAVLEEIASKKQKPSEDEAEDEQQEEGGEETKKTKKKSGKLANARNLKGKYTVQTVKHGASEASQRQTAEDFLQSRLYGAGSCRTTSNELLSLENKKGRNKSAAVTFVNKDWACREKAKAEKLKKRWIHKQQIPC
ncbi:U3 small nucleolar RNA-associated protein NOL7 [Pseudochaenichthys georgianus]|uniref:U3 small nucleolar RNA-associated protein NOL7 n=1 Tax=Pseudochaenichthys georgianus TaxID=52239 RepID=UPI0039C305E3